MSRKLVKGAALLASAPMLVTALTAWIAATSATARAADAPEAAAARVRGRATADLARPARFPHRIWAACDFEGRTPDYAWFGRAETHDIPAYPGNATALRAPDEPYEGFSARMAGINPVPGPRMGKENWLWCRYRLKGGTEATFQHFSLTREDNHHIVVSGLREGEWSEVALNFTRDARRNDGSEEAFAEGERMDDLKVFVGKPGDGKDHELLLDDVIFFAEDPSRPPEDEPFPRRVIFLAAFDTGITPADLPKYYPGELAVVTDGVPPDTWWGAARAVPRRVGGGKWIRLEVRPPRPVGANTHLRFRYHATDLARLTVQIFDATAGDNRHIRLDRPENGAWTQARLDFQRDSRRNDGSEGKLEPGNLIDDIFFLPEGAAGREPDLLVDEVILYDAGEPPTR